MKVLFAVNSESVSDAIIKKYQKDYRGILSYKNVYYFNAIQKEIQKDKTYDRIVISEDLEPFSNNNYESIDKFIFEKLDLISDEAHDNQGREISIILICSDRHTKGSSFLVKLFGIGVYNALLGNDRSMEEVCRLINKPRTKKEAKKYYKIDTDDVNYSSENENEVSEMEIQNIITHFKKLGKNSSKYESSFANIASQYNEEQLKIIINCLPFNIKSILEQSSAKYAEVMAKNGVMVKGVKNSSSNTIKDQQRTGLKIDIIENKLNQTKINKPIVIPNSVKTAKSNNAKKVISIQPNTQVTNENKANKTQLVNSQKINNIKSDSQNSIEDKNNMKNTPTKKKVIIKKQIIDGKVVKKKVLVPEDYEIRTKKKDISSKNEVKKVKPVRKTSTTINEKENYDDELDDIELAPNNLINENVEITKKGRGRPRKNPVSGEVKPKGKRGRPRKINDEATEINEDEFDDLETINQEQMNFNSIDDDEVINNNTFEDIEDDSETDKNDEFVLPDLDDLDDIDDDLEDEPFDEFDEYDEYGQEIPTAKSKSDDVDELYNEDMIETDLEETDDNDEDDMIDDTIEDDFVENETDDENSLFSDFDDDTDELLSELDFDDNDDDDDDNLFDDIENEENSTDENLINSNSKINYQKTEEYQSESLESIKSPIDYSMSNLNSLMTKDKKIVALLGSPKNGVSFLVNNLAEIFASVGIKTAILDMTKNKNSYYIYTQNDESLRKIAYSSLENLQKGVSEGIRVKQNLTVFTALPNDGKDYSNAEPILSTLVQDYSLILIDCDFYTNPSYFASSQEIYLVQSMDILTIQPLTAFLRELMTQGVLESEKIKVVINKELKVRGLTNKAIIGGMSYYNDPAMSFMTELFNKDTVKYCSIPFEEIVYAKYLEAILNCKVSINGYSKNFMNKLRVLADMVYPLTSRQSYSPNSNQSYVPPQQQSNFSSSMNDTLNKMKNKF